MFGRPLQEETGETEFKAAKEKWETISATVMKPFKTKDERRAFLHIQPTLTDIMRLLNTAVKKNHLEGTRCYAGLLLMRLMHKMKLFVKQPPTFEDLQAFYWVDKATFDKIITCLDNPAFSNDLFSWHVRSAAMIFDKDTYCLTLLGNVHALSEINSPFLPWSIIKAREFNYSIPHINHAFQRIKQRMQYPDWQYYFLLQSEKWLEKLKEYTLEDAQAMLLGIKLPFEPVRCDFFELPLPSEKELKSIIDSLLILKATLEIRGNTQTFLPILQRGAPKQKEEKRGQPEAPADVTLPLPEKTTPVDPGPVLELPQEHPAPAYCTPSRIGMRAG